MNKKGDLSIGFIAGLIITLVGFAILLYAYYQLSFVGEIDREVCHQSVVLRATFPDLAQGYAPLKCNTEKICITGKLIGKGECGEFKNEKSYTTVRVGNNQDSLNKIQRIYAQELLSCWSTMGEGKVSLFSQGVAKNFGLGSVYPTCVICSRIAVDKKNLDKVDFSKMDLFDYMNTRLVPTTEKTYLQTLAGGNYGTISLGDSLISDEEIPYKDAYGKDASAGVYFDAIRGININDKENIPPETAILFMQITAPEHGSVLKNTIVSLAGAGAAASLTKIGRGFIGTITAGAGGQITAAAGAALLIYQQGNVAYQRAVSASYCDDVSIGSARSGCSVIRTTDYNPKDILEYCSVIESIP